MSHSGTAAAVMLLILVLPLLVLIQESIERIIAEHPVPLRRAVSTLRPPPQQIAVAVSAVVAAAVPSPHAMQRRQYYGLRACTVRGTRTWTLVVVGMWQVQVKARSQSHALRPVILGRRPPP